jgi:hypothetical protein
MKDELVSYSKNLFGIAIPAIVEATDFHGSKEI